MCTVSNAPGVGGGSWFDPLRRREEFADVFASARPRVEVEAVAALAARGVLDLVWVRELFADSDALVAGVFALDRIALRDAYALLFVGERLITSAVAGHLAGSGSDIGPHVIDAIGETVGTVTDLARLARAWTWFVNGDIERDQ